MVITLNDIIKPAIINTFVFNLFNKLEQVVKYLKKQIFESGITFKLFFRIYSTEKI